jgi:two-component system cell cycle sensor histidine kinase/response regulator CckA
MSPADYQLIFDAASTSLLLLTPDFRIAAASDGYLQATRTTREEILGRDLCEVFPAEDLRDSLMTVLATRTPGVMTLQKCGGEKERVWSRRNDPVLSAGGDVVYILHRLEDVTGLVERNSREEAAVRESQKMDAIRRLAGGIAHDLNNLLTVIQGYNGILTTAVESDAARDSVHQIEKAAGQAATLTGQLLAFSRKPVLDLRPVDLNRVIGGMEESLQRVVGDAIALQVDLDSALPQVSADTVQMEQALIKLAVHARNAMAHGGGRLTVSTRAMHDGSAVLKIADTGVGMDDQTRARIFEPLFTTEKNGKDAGLSAVFTVVEQCGGTISVESEPGRGTTFTIVLPGAAGRTQTPDAVSPGTPWTTRGDAAMVLLVEDEEPLRRLVRGILNEAGCRVLEATGGADALRASREYAQTIDLLITDVVMPGMGGPELAARLQMERPGMPILFISGYGDELNGEALAGSVHCLGKPFTRKALSQKVGVILGKRAVRV